MMVKDDIGQTWNLDGKWHRAVAGFYYRLVSVDKDAGKWAFLYVHDDRKMCGWNAGWGYDWGWYYSGRDGKGPHQQALEYSKDGGSSPNKRSAIREAEESVFKAIHGRYPADGEVL